MLENNQAEDLLNQEDHKRIVENLLFITDRPVSIAKISQVAEINNLEATRDVVAALQQDYAETGRAIQIIEIGGGFQMATKPEYGRWVRKLFNEKMSVKLSNAALETLAIVAYKQPITRAEIEAIRGVDIVAPLEKIMERGLVKIVGKRDAPGKPMLYGTTEEFLRLFGLNKLTDLPELKEFAAKGPRQMQGDLPFSESLPDIKEAILPLDEEDGEDPIEILPDTFVPLPTPKEDIVVPGDNAEEASDIEAEEPAAQNNNPQEDSVNNESSEQETEEPQVIIETTEEVIIQVGEDEELAAPEPKDENLPENMQIDDIKDLNP